MQEKKEPILLRTTAEWVTCVKPAGVDSEKELPRILGEMLGEQALYPVHRLDMNVGGVMVYARSPKAAAELSRLIQNGLFQKDYLALVHGSLTREGRMEDLLWKDSRQNKVFVVRRVRQGVHRASLSWQRLFIVREDQTAVAVHLETGRSHQIRVQFASRGCPIWGDHKYGARDHEKELLLFSHQIHFFWKGQPISIKAWPDWWPSENESGSEPEGSKG